MIPNAKDSVLVTGGVSATSTFGISLADAPHLMTILSSTLYTDKVMAVLREYSANAWDAHREAGKADLPIQVTLPTSMAPTLVIRDYGLGLSPDDVFQIYTQYGASTKRRSNDAVGMLGIGSKAGFAYSESFTVTSWCEGKKSIYSAVKTPAGIYEINQLHQEDCSDQETGIEVQIAAKPVDIMEFHNKAKQLFKYYDPKPTINTDLPAAPNDATKLKHGTLIKGNADGWYAIMGCVPYKVDVTQVQAINNDGTGVADYINKISGILNFNIGEIQVAASREGLEYTEFTKKALIEKFSLAVDEYVQYSLDNITNKSIPSWNKRIQMQVLVTLHLPIPKKHKEMLQDRADLKGKPKTFIISQHGNVVASIGVSNQHRLVFRDDAQDMAGYHLTFHDYVIEKKDVTTTWDDVEAELKDFLEKNDLDGMPSIKISTLPWYMPTRRGRGYSNKVKNPKHQAKVFKLIPGKYFNTSSNNWELVTRTPHQKDVFAIIERFEAIGYSITSLYHQDSKLAKLFGVTMPEIYGYKNTIKKPVNKEDCLGTEYLEWRKAFIKSLFTKRIARLYTHWEWSQAADDERNRSPKKGDFETIRKKLGASHEITKLFKKQQAGERVVRKMKSEMREALQQFRERLFTEEQKKPEYEGHLDRVLKKYPLLEIYELEALWDDHADEWVKYVKLVDQA